MSTFQRIVRGPFLWILIVILAASWVIQLTGQITGYKDVPTSQVIQLINSDTPLKEVILTDTEQTIEVTEADAKQTKIKATWVGTESQDIITRLNARVAAGTLESWKGVNPNLGFWGSLVGTLVPFLIIGVIFYFLINSLQGGGSRVMQFGKSKAKIATKDTPKTTFADEVRP